MFVDAYKIMQTPSHDTNMIQNKMASHRHQLPSNYVGHHFSIKCNVFSNIEIY